MAESNVEDPGTTLAEPCKRLRFADPDLKIILKYDDENSKQPTQKVYPMYSSHLAKLSKFIDTSLSVEMKEKDTREIILHDVTPHIFEQALKYLQDPVAARSFGTEEAVQFAEFYDKYEFTCGIALCDNVLTKYLSKSCNEGIDTMPEDLDFLVEAAATAFQFNLLLAKGAAFKYIKSRMDFETSSRFGPCMFTEYHIKKLHPLFKQGLYEEITWPAPMTRDRMVSPLFPTYFSTWTSDLYSGQLCRKVTVSGTKTIADGTYYRERRHSYRTVPALSDGENFVFLMHKVNGDWAISVAGDDGSPAILLWEATFSDNLEVPPEGPWDGSDVHDDWGGPGTKAMVSHL